MRIKQLAIGICMSSVLAVGCDTDDAATAEDVVMRLQSTDRLYVTEYVVHKIITADDVKMLQGQVLNQKFKIRLPVGDRKIAIPMDAVIKAYVDFGSFSKSDVLITDSPRGIRISLPEPRVEMVSSKIDHKGIKEYTDLLRTSFSDAEMADLERQGRAAIMAAVPSMGIENTAKRNAREMLMPILMQAGFSADMISIDFKPSYVGGR